MLADQQYLSIPATVRALRDNGLDVSESTVRRWVKSGRLEAVRLPSGMRRIPRTAVDAITTVDATASAA